MGFRRTAGDGRTLDGDATGGDDDRLYGGDGNDFIQADSSASLSLLRESGSLCGRSI